MLCSLIRSPLSCGSFAFYLSLSFYEYINFRNAKGIIFIFIWQKISPSNLNHGNDIFQNTALLLASRGHHADEIIRLLANIAGCAAANRRRGNTFLPNPDLVEQIPLLFPSPYARR